MQDSIIAGLVSGFFVTLFALAFRGFWNSVIIPWFENRVYKDIRIEGKWFCLYPEDSHYRQEVAVLHRKGHEITGKIICTAGKDEGEEYNVIGSFRNLLLPLTYESTDKTKSDRGSITLKSIRNGERLSGKVALYNTIEDNISSGTVLWFRVKDELDKTIDKIKSHEEKFNALNIEKERIEKEKAELEDINNDNIIEGEQSELKS